MEIEGLNTRLLSTEQEKQQLLAKIDQMQTQLREYEVELKEKTEQLMNLQAPDDQQDHQDIGLQITENPKDSADTG